MRPYPTQRRFRWLKQLLACIVIVGAVAPVSADQGLKKRCFVARPAASADDAGSDYAKEFFTFVTVSGSTWRLPSTIGWPADPDLQCRATQVYFRLWWDGTDLHEDTRTVRKAAPASRKVHPRMLEFFGKFVLSSDRVPQAPWKRRGVAPMAGFANVNVLPVADYPAERYVPRDISSVSAWSPLFEFHNLKDGDGKPIVFSCSGMTLEKGRSGIAMHMPAVGPPNVCIAYFSISDRFVGHIRISDKNFFANGELLFKKLNVKLSNYIIH